MSAFNPELADRIEYYDAEAEGLSLFEQFHVHEQVHKALDRKVWLPSGGSLIIEHTEALTVIDVNTGKNVGTSSLEETVFHNNLEAAEEIAKQLRLRDIGGIIVIDFIDMEIRDNRDKVVEVFRNALARDKTRSQVFAISDLGLVEMTRKRIGEGLLTEFSTMCDGLRRPRRHRRPRPARLNALEGFRRSPWCASTEFRATLARRPASRRGRAAGRLVRRYVRSDLRRREPAEGGRGRAGRGRPPRCRRG